MYTRINLREFLTKSQRNKEMICYDGFSYNYKLKKDEQLLWRCNNRGCTAVLVTDLEYHWDSVLIYHSNHARNAEKERGKTMITAIKARCVETSETSRDIVLKIIENSEQAFNKNYNIKYLKDTATKTRKSESFTAVRDSDIPIEIRTTKFNTNFIQHDHTDKNGNRIIIFSTESDLVHLSTYKIWFIDCTFAVVPKPFYQLLIIQSLVRGDFIPLLFCLLPNKELNSYKTIFELLKEKFAVNPPDRIILDYETAIFTAASNTFKSTIISGCLFHFSQIVWRKIQNLGYTKLYKDGTTFYFQFI
jgi:hypothetical protein